MSTKSKQGNNCVLNPEASESSLPLNSYIDEEEKVFKLKLSSNSSKTLKSPVTPNSPDMHQKAWTSFISKIKKQDLKSSYKIKNTIGVGTYGKVKYGIHRSTLKQVAIKSLPIAD